MASSPKISRLDTSCVPGPGSVALSASKNIPRTAKLDFAANPNHYRTNGLKKAKLSGARGMDLSPRLVLGLSLECETNQILDPDFEE
jgi:hypothetical protein